MKEIVLTRIDDRLVHGQIMTQWTRMYHPTTIMVVDNVTYADAFLAQILLMAVPKEYKTVVANIEKAVEYLTEDIQQEERIMILVKTPETAEAICDKGVPLKSLNVGGMGTLAGRTTLYRNIAASQKERDTMIRLCEKGVRVYVQIVPDDKEVEIEKLI